MTAAGYGTEQQPRVGFFTDTSVCIGCKACEVACKEWNGVPDEPLGLTGESYDNSGALGANRWRHVAFIEQERIGGRRLPVADVLRRMQALHRGSVPRRVPDRRDLPHASSARW